MPEGSRALKVLFRRAINLVTGGGAPPPLPPLLRVSLTQLDARTWSFVERNGNRPIRDQWNLFKTDYCRPEKSSQITSIYDN